MGGDNLKSKFDIFNVYQDMITKKYDGTLDGSKNGVIYALLDGSKNNTPLPDA